MKSTYLIFAKMKSTYLIFAKMKSSYFKFIYNLGLTFNQPKIECFKCFPRKKNPKLNFQNIFKQNKYVKCKMYFVI